MYACHLDTRNAARIAPRGQPDGRTRLTDRVEYRLPAGALGRLADTLIVRRMLLRSFRERHEGTRALLEDR